MSPGVTKTHRYVKVAIPDRATVQWRTPDKVLHSKEVDVRSILPKNFSDGDIIFDIHDDNDVRVSTE